MFSFHRQRHRSFWVFGGLGVGIFLIVLGVDSYLGVRALKSRYPVVEYKGKGNPPFIRLVKSRPSSWVRLDQISKMATGAILVSEDWAFYSHKGFDTNQIRESIRVNLKEHRYARGASTITQQVARNLFLSHQKTLWRKLREIVLAVCLEQTLGKSKILEIYLNVAEWGEGIYGIEAASEFYFSLPPSSLDAKQGAFLAMLLPSPQKYGVSFRKKELTPYAQRTVDSILWKMVQAGYIGIDEARAQAYAPLSFEQSALEDEVKPEPELEP